jgi:FMN-dependent oxidoreductase (nitrilotriacetate monooxygenase family)
VHADKETGVWGDSNKIYPPAHEGRFYRVAGALNVPRSAQGHPVLVQAGSSENGRNFAARYAEAVFTAHQTLADAQEFYDDLKRRAAEHGRDPDHVKILPGIVPIIGATEAEAHELEQELNRLIRPEYALPQLASLLGVDVADLRLDAELPDHLPDEAELEGAKSRRTLVVNLGRRERLTVREIIARLGGGRGHLTFAGTPAQVAGAILAWYEAGAADGFNIMPPVLPSGLTAFVDEVVPILQERGRFRTEYQGTTLRDHLGLPRPENRNAAARRPAGAHP